MSGFMSNGGLQAVLGAATQLTGSFLGFFGQKDTNDTNIEITRLQLEQQDKNNAANLELTKENIKGRINILNAETQNFILKLNAKDKSLLNNKITDTTLYADCVKSYNATGQLSPICEKAGYTEESIAEVSSNKRKRTTAIVVLIVIAIVGVVIFKTKNNG